MIEEKFTAWLEDANERFRREELPPAHRPFRAFADYCEEHSCSLAYGSPIADAIFAWFYKHSAPGSHQVGSLFTGAYYYDAFFWPVNIPIGYGRATLDVFNSLESMPDAIKRSLAKDKAEADLPVLHWADCVDYGYGFDDIAQTTRLTERALAFARNGDRELIGAIRQILHPRPNLKSILGFRMAAEIFMKVVLVQERGLSDRELQKLGHSIERLAKECHAQTGMAEFAKVARDAAAFPDVSDRYDGEEKTPREVWTAALVAQRAASAFARKYSDRDMRAQVVSSLRPDG